MRKRINIIGGGASALMLACELDPQKFEVTLYEKNNQLGRKFLVAGEGGLNLTHSEQASAFISRYTPSAFLQKAFSHFSNVDLLKWLSDLGIETYVGSSGRVFPKKGTKPIAVLNAILHRIKKRGVQVVNACEWKGFTETNALLFKSSEGNEIVSGDICIFCLGGASWPVTGSAGDWRDYFKAKQIHTKDFEASNCAFRIDWPQLFVHKIEGSILKNCAITCIGQSNLGEVVLTKFGMEGSGIYPLSPQIREGLKKSNSAEITIDLKPNVSLAKMIERLSASKGENTYTKHVMTQLNLSDTHMRLLKQIVNKDEFLDVKVLAKHIKNLKIVITGLGPVEDAISTVGGIDLSEIDENFELRKLKNNFVIGEMLDYDAPTGGYLLQSCFSMAKYLADYLNGNF